MSEPVVRISPKGGPLAETGGTMSASLTHPKRAAENGDPRTASTTR